ncbi:hypothetical protein [Levilactobacillus brevis]|uniref:hypothetical protein n=1 Tax=Levilactobacillus brevis TaxID=1580 RepID=UPI000A2FDAE7|nr:hypothetical protein [Levilactobacillus brevis]ARQ92190.1 hypothetical protein A6F60_00015 [Levilactobacillus brevis]ARQ94289.1 hypothetical protein A6F60_11525 [Levilactobacillus brevis]
MYFNSLNQLYKDYSIKFKNNKVLKDELDDGVYKLNRWVVSIAPRYNQNINVLDFSNSEQVRLEVALRIFDDVTRLGMFVKVYRYRDEFTGDVVAQAYTKDKIRELGKNGRLVNDITGEEIQFVPDLIEKYFKLSEDPNESFNDQVSNSSVVSKSEEPLTPKYIKDHVKDFKIIEGDTDF